MNKCHHREQYRYVFQLGLISFKMKNDSHINEARQQTNKQIKIEKTPTLQTI